jgi:hypothetical protein
MSTIINTSAGVYVSVEDRSQNLRIKKQVSIGAIVLFANQGPVDQMVLIDKGVDEFINTFGIPDVKLGYGHFCAIQALRYMPELYVTRVHRDARYGGVKVYVPTAGTKLAIKQFNTPKCVDPYDPNKFYLESASGFFNDATDFFYVYGQNPSTINANYRITVESYRDASDPTRPNTFQILVWSAKLSKKPLETWTVSRDHQVDGYGRQQHLEAVINGNSKYIRVLDNPLNTTPMSADLLPSDGSALRYLEEVATIPAVPANPLATPPTPYIPEIPGVAAGTLARLSAGHNGNTAAYNSTSAIPTTDLGVIYNGDLDPFPAEVTDPPIDYKRSGWTLYIDREEVKFDLLINAGVCIPSVQSRMVEVADKRGDVFAILDVPLDAQGDRYNPTEAAVKFRNDPLGLGGSTTNCINTADAALYTPWIETMDKYTGRMMVLPPSGHIASIFCKTDIDYATWFAPAGLKRGQLILISHRQQCCIIRKIVTSWKTTK